MKIKSKKVGLALGGGAVLGAAHIGVLRALKEHDVSIEFISGTSIGAFVAALFAFGNNCEEVEEIAIDLSWKNITSISFSKMGLFSNDKIKNFLDEKIGEKTFDMAEIPIAMIAADISTGEKVILKEGLIAEAVMASTCIPGIFQPTSIGNRLLVDGGIVENVPISPLMEMGADYIIAIDLNAKLEYDKPENMIDVLMNSFHYSLANVAKLQTQKADLLIQPDLSSFNHIDVSQTKNLIEVGYEETIKALSQTD